MAVIVSRVSSLFNDSNGDTKVSPNDTLITHIVITNATGSPLAGVTVNDTLTSNTTYVANSTVVTVGDQYTGLVGNTPISFGTGEGVLANDYHFDGANAGLNTGLTVATVNGTAIGAAITIHDAAVPATVAGTVDVHADGSFTFTPATGYVGTAAFTYTDSDGSGTVGTGTVTLTISSQVWYVDSGYVGANGTADGSYLKPFTTFASLNGAGDKDNPGDSIVVHGGPTGGGLTLEAGEALYGDGVLHKVNDAYAVNGVTHSTAATTVTSGSGTSTMTAASGNVITLSTNNTIDGITVTTSGTATGIADNAASVTTVGGTATILHTSVSGSGQAVSITHGGNLAAAFTSLSSSGGATAVNLAGTATSGTGLLSGSLSSAGGAITGNTAKAFVIGTSATAGSGGSIDVTYGGTISNTATGAVDVESKNGGSATFSGNLTFNGTTGTGITVNNNTAGTTSFTGQNIAVTSTTGTAVSLTANTGATITFNPTAGANGFDVSSTTGAGLVFTGGGTLNVQGTGNSVATTTGHVLDFANGLIGAGNVTFAGLTATAQVVGTAISLNNIDNNSFSGGVVSIAGATVDGIAISGGSNTAATFGNTSIGNGISAVAGHGIGVADSSSNVTFNGTVSVITNNAGGIGINLHNDTGTIGFTGGTKTITTTGGDAIHIDSNAAAVSFTGGGLAVTSTTGDAIDAQGTTPSATNALTISGNGNTVSTTSGVGVKIDGVQTDVTLQSVKVSAATTDGIYINNGGITAASKFVIQGTGTAASNTLTGTGAAATDGSNLNGIGIYLNNIGNVDINKLTITNDWNNFGIRGDHVYGFKLHDSTLNGTFGDNNAFDEDAIRFGVQSTTSGIVGTGLFEGNTIGGGYEDNLDLYLYGSDTANITIQDSAATNARSTFNPTMSPLTNGSGNDNIIVESGGNSTLTLKIDHADVKGAHGDQLQIVADDNTIQHLTINNNDFNNFTQNANTIGGDVYIGGGGDTATYHVDFVFSNNRILYSKDTAAAFIYGGNTQVVAGTISNNTIGTASGGGTTLTDGSGSKNGIGIEVDSIHQAGAGQSKVGVTISGNQIHDWSNLAGIALYATGNAGDTGSEILQATITGNTVNEGDNAGSASLAALYAWAGSKNAGDNGVIGLSLSGNTFTAPSAAFSAIDLDQLNTNNIAHYNIPNYNNAGAANHGESHPAGGTATTSLQSFWTSAAGGSNVLSGGSQPLYAGTTAGITNSAFVSIVPLQVAAPPPADASDDRSDSGGIVTNTDGDPNGGTGGTTGRTTGDTGATTGDGGPAPTPPAGPASTISHNLTQTDLDQLVGAAIHRWELAGATPEQLAAMKAVTVSVSDIAGLGVGDSTPGHILVSSSGAGYGWFIDATPDDDSEFEGAGTDLTAAPGTVPYGHVDLLTVLEHELGHQIGLIDDYSAADAADLMYGFVNAGERRLAAPNDVAAASGAPVDHESFVLSTVSVPAIAAGNSIDVSFRSTVNTYAPGTVPSLTGQSTVSYTGLVTPLTSTETITPTGDSSTASDGTLTHPNLTQATLTLGNLVFNDLNKNGSFDGSDTGIGNVTVKLYIDNGTAAGVWDAGDTQVTSTTTSNVAGTVGQYSFTNLAPGDYIVVIPSTNFASGQPLNALVPHSGALDPDNNTDNDNNGIAVSGGNVASQAITLAFDTETTNTAGADTNNTLDFGFQTNSPPVANADPLAATDEDTPAIYAASAFTGNDTDPDGDTFAITSVGSPSHGTAVLNGDGTVTYTPTGNYNGTDSFSYTITDSHGATASATASLTVNAVNDPVTVTVPSAPTINEDAGSTAISGMSIADVDATLAPNGIYQVVLAATHGTLTLTTTTGLTFSGGSDGTADATMTFSGKLADINAGLATAHFTADNNFNGDAQITLSATDNVGGTNATGSGSGTNASSPFLVHVTSINDAPSGQDSGTHVFDNDVHTFTAADFPFTDVESNPLGGVKVDDLPVKGTLLLNGSPVTAGTLISATDINAGHFTYDPDDTTGGQAYSFHFQVQDGGGTANGGVDLDPTQHVFTLTVDVSHINQAPAGTDFNTVIAEDGKDVFAASDFGFVDSDSAPYTNTLLAVKIATAPTNGTIYYDADNNAATPDTALGAGDSMSKIGLDAGQYYYKPNADYNGNDGFTFQVQDNGGTAHSGVDTDQSANSYTIAVNPVNDAPVNHVPSSPTIDEDTGITFSAANTNAITVSDVDAGSGTITVTVTSDHGILTPGSTNVPGATVSGGGFTPAVTISGTVSAVNAALDGLNYHTGLNFNGNDTITITTKDGGNTGSGGEQTTTTQLPVTVNPLNDAPTVVNGTTAAATAITEDSPSATGQTVSSLFSSHFSDATDNMAAYGGSSPNAFAGVFVSGNGSAAAQGQWQYYNGASWVDIGSVSETAAKFLSATTAIRFNPAQDFNGSAPTLTVHVADDSTAYSNGNTVDTNYGTALGAIGAWSVDTVTLSETVTAVDDNPVLATTGTSFNYTEGDPQHPLFATLTVSDVDNTNFNGGTLSIVDNAVNGTGDGLQLGGVASISFDPNTNEISYNNVVFGTLTFLANGYSIALNDKATPNAVQALLSDLQYVNTSDDPAAGDHPLLVTLTDGAGGSASFTTHVNVIPVNDPPLSDHLDGDVVTYTEDAPAVRTDNGHDATLSDPDNHTYGGATLVVSVSGNKVASEDQIVFLVPTIQAASTLSTSGGNLYFGSTQIGTISAGGVGLDRTVTFNSNADAGMVQLLLREIAYQDTNHATPSTAQRTIEYKITDPSSGVTTVHSLVNVADVNDPPVNTVPTPQTLNEDATLTFNTANGNVISVSDADAGSASLTATVSALHGSLMLSGTANLTVSGNGSETVHLAGSQADINAALQGLTYTPTPNYNGGDTLTLVTADNGNSGTGGNKTDTDTLAITVNAMNDAPVITSSPTVNATEQTPIVINPSLSVTDIDLDALNGGHGDYAGASFVINVPNTPNPDDVFGFDIADASFTVSGNNLQSGGQTFATFAMSGGILNISFTSSGTIATRLLVDDVLQHVTYENTSDAPPASETLGYGFIDGAPGHGQGTVVNNNNFAGNGVTVNIAAVDDAPTNHVPIGQNVNEDGTLVFSSGNANAITVTDPDSGSGSITVTLTAAHGTLTLGSTASVTPVNNGSGSVQVTGTAANVNAAMNGLTYAPTGDFNGDDTVTVATSDNSQTGSGGPLGDSDPVTIHVAAVNDAPTIVNAATATAPAIDEDVPSGAGDTVASLFGSHYSDAADDQSANGGSSAGAFSGIAVTGNLSGVAGQWQYWNGASWTNVGAVSNASALTLAASTAIRFNPAPDYNGAAPALTVHLADNTASITDGGHINLSGAGATGGTTPWSTGTVALAETVNPVDDAPVIDLDGGSAGFNSSGNFNEGDGPLLLAPNGTVVDVDSPDFDGGTLTVAFTGGSSQYDQLVVTGLDPDAGGQIFNGGGDVIATVAGGSDPSDPLIITFTSFATASDVQGVMHKVAYADYTNALTGGDRTISFTLTDGDGGTSNVATATVHVTAVDSPPVLTDDHVGTDEVSTVIIPVTANDSDPDGPPPAVTKINGSAISTGQTITLPSGAKLTLNADGTLTYDPNHQFDTLTSPSGGETGASNTSATDSFTYSVQDGSTASVSVQIDGVANAADHLEGSPGGDVIHGTPNADYFDFSQGGSDSGFGLGGNDAFFFGSAYDQDDTVDGGAGTDTVGIRGNYTGLNAITILGGNMVNTEVLNFMTSNGGPVGYDVTWQDGNLANGQKMSIYGGNLAAGENLTFDGSAETHGFFIMYGGLGTDNFKGGAGSDGFYFGPGKFSQADHVDGGGGTQNQLGLDGSYNFSSSSALGTLGGNFVNIQSIVLYNGNPADFSDPYPNVYHIETNDAAVGAGKTLAIYGALTVADFYFNGSAEMDGNFKIYGGIGNDTLIGGAGNDLIFGSQGSDTLTGGGGADTFVFTEVNQSTAASPDRITDFTNGDKIDLSQFDADTSTAGQQSFSFIGTGAFTNHAGELRAEFDAVHNIWTVQGDVDGDGHADLTILVSTTGGHAMTGTDFFL